MSDSAPRLTRRLIVVMVTLLLVGGGAWGFSRVRHIYRAPGPMPVAADIVIPRGNMQMTLATLRATHLIRPDDMTAFIFRHIVQLTRHQGALHSGEFSFPAGASMRQVMAILRHGKPVQHFITVPEGITAAQIHDLLAAAPGLTGVVPALEEGEILPQTLSYRYGDQRRQLVERYRALMQEALKKAWETRNPDPALTSPRDLLILASMVERETARDDERALVARVLLNRLTRGMRLQSDPTAIYDVSQGEGVLPHPLTRSELAFNEGHNTYAQDGLPSGPICAPGYAAIMAVAHAPQGDALYFVAKGDGSHVFSTTLKAHIAEVRRYRHHLPHPAKKTVPAQ